MSFSCRGMNASPRVYCAGPLFNASERAEMAEIAAHLEGPTVVCGHRPVLPSMFAGLGLAARPMVVGEALVIHLDADGGIVRSEILKPTA